MFLPYVSTYELPQRHRFMICTDPVKLSILILSVRSLHRFIYFIHVRIPCKTVQKIPSKDIPLDTIILFYVLSVIYPRNDKKNYFTIAPGIL